MADTNHERDATVSLRFELDAKEWRRADVAAIRATLFGRIMWNATRILPLIVPLPFAAALILGTGPPLDVISAAVPWELIALFFYAGYALWPSLTAALTARRSRGRPEERTVSQAGLDVAGSIDGAFVPWADIRGIQETSEFFLFRSPRAVYYIPKRVLSESQAGQVRALVSEHASMPIRLFLQARRAT